MHGLRLFKRPMQRNATSVLGSLELFLMTEFIINRLKGTESQDGMASCSALRRAKITNDLCKPPLVEDAAKLIRV